MEEGKFFGENDEKGKKSLWHGGMAYLERIDYILRSLDSAWIADERRTGIPYINGLSIGRYQQILSLLNILFKELSCKMILDERKEYLAAKKEAERLFDITQNEIAANKNTVTNSFIAFFNEWEMEMRAFAERKGLIMPEKKEGLDAADN